MPTTPGKHHELMAYAIAHESKRRMA
jgi:hypothetical protein